MTETRYATTWWTSLDDGRVRRDVCPRACALHEGQAGLCFVRRRADDRIVLSTYGRSSGFCVDPIEKKPLNHFLPGTSVLSFGTAGCNLACRFCQNWDISKSREVDTLADAAAPGETEAISRWIVERLGPDVPVHFTAFHPDWKLRDRPPTPPATLVRAREIALAAGIRYAYTGNVHDPAGQSTRCHRCGAVLI